MWIQNVLLLLFFINFSFATIPILTYSNAQLKSNNTISQLADDSFIHSSTDCICQCLNNSNCLTAAYIGINQTCSLFSSEITKDSLQLVVTDMNAQVFLFPNRTISTTTMTTTTTATTVKRNITCGSTCVNTTTSTSSRLAFYSFDSVTTDATGNYPASGIASPDYVSGYVNAAVNFNSSNAQRFTVGNIPLNNRSFSIDFWFYATNLSAWDYSFMGEYSSQSSDKCLFINIRSQTLFFGFYADDLAGVTQLVINKWYHAAFIYDSTIRQQSIYLNGILESQRTASNHFLGSSIPFTIGGATIGGSTSLYVYYSGIIDHVTISNRVKTSCEIYLDANLACYFTFDSTSSINDSGPNFLTATNTGATNGEGIVNYAAQFTSSLSYITIYNISALKSENNVFSISMWIYPTSVNGGATLIHASTQSNGEGTCFAMWGLTANGTISVNVINSTKYTFAATASSVLPLNTWTHIAQTFSSINGSRLYINGILVNTVNATTGFPLVPYIFIGASPTNTTNCANGSIIPGQFYGMVDELRVFRAQLTQADVCRLANP